MKKEIKITLYKTQIMKELKKRTCKVLCTFVLLTSFFSQAKAQFEPQFTQYMFNEMFINPAYAGTRDHISMTALYRNQWVGIDGAPKTQTFSAHAPLKNDKVGLGLTVLNEEIGVTRDFAVFGNYAYKIPMGKGFFSMGLQGGVINHQESLNNVITQDQSDNSFFGTPKVVVPNAGFGIYYYARNYYGGLSVPRFIQNNVNASTGKAENKVDMSYWHYYLMGGYVHAINENIKLKPTFMLKVVEGAPLEADLGLNALLNETIWFGASYRTNDSWALIFQIQLTQQLRLGYSYDYTLTDLQQYNTGSHEITLGYDFSFNKNKIVTPRYF